jgi:hypothetical protein
MEYDEFLDKLKSAPLLTYKQRALIPSTSGVYAAWMKGEVRCIYAGKSTNLHSRIKSHFSGQRGSDQFCLYVYDFYIHNTRPLGLDTAQVNELTSDWIRKNVFFRYVELSKSEISEQEDNLRKAYEPILNPLL